MTPSDPLITVNFQELFNFAESHMMREDDLCWALGMALINTYSNHAIVSQLEEAMIKRVNEKQKRKVTP